MEILSLVLIMLAAGSLAGLAAGIFGIGGGLIVVPTLVGFFPMLGTDPELAVRMAVGTSLSTIIITSLRATQAHAKKDSVDFEVLKTWAPWVALGVAGGTFASTQLRAKVILLMFASFLFILSFRFMFPQLLEKIKLGDDMPKGIIYGLYGIFLGSASALFGIGGGSIVILIMTFHNRAIHQAIGTASGIGIIIASLGTISVMIAGWGQEGLPIGSIGYVNLIGFLSIIATSTFTAPIGVKFAHKLDPKMMKKVFGIYLIFTSLMMFWRNLH